MWIRLALVFALSGCVSSKDITYNIESVPQGAIIDVNGIFVGTTPTSVNFTCSKEWVGVLRAPDGWLVHGGGPYNVTAFPPESTKGDSQTKVVRPCQWKGSNTPSLMFDLRLRHVLPVQRVETKDLTEEPSKKLDSLEFLNKLKSEGVITEEEYRERARQLL